MAEFMILATLFATARKSALQTDRVIEDMLEVLRRE
jgi:hypothetical protein